MNIRVQRLAMALLATAALLGAGDAWGQTTDWRVSSGTWSNSANWDNGVPTANYVANVQNNGIATISQPGATCYSLSLGGSGSGTVYMIGGSLAATGEYLGDLGTGFFTQSGGTNSCGEEMIFGNAAGKDGTYYLDAGAISADNEEIGFSGSGSLAQYGGVNSLSAYLTLGHHFGSSGTYILSGGSLSDPLNETIGNSGYGSFIQTGGTNTISGHGQVLTLANSSTSTGTYTLNGGLLTIPGLTQGSGNALFSFGGGTMQAGLPFATSVPILLSTQGSTAVFDTDTYGLILNGNVLTLNGVLSGPGSLQKIGADALTLTATNTFTGDVRVSAGTLRLPSGQLPANFEYVGDTSGAAAVLSQSGGSNIVASDLHVGYYGNGTFALSGGQLSAGNEIVGDAISSVGAFVHNGGTNTVAANLTVGNLSPYAATYSMSGASQLSVGNNEYIGYGKTGVFNQSDGNHSVANNLYLAYNPGSNGTYNLSGGSLAVATEYVGYNGTGILNQSSGTHSVANNLYLGYNAGSSGTYNMTGGLLDPATEYIGASGGGLGVFNQAGGVNIAGNVNINNGYYNLTGGTLQILSGGTVQVYNGGMQVTGGTVDFGGNSVTVLADSSILDLSNRVVNSTAVDLSGGPNALIIVPQGFDPATFGSFSASFTHTLGTDLNVPSGSGFGGAGNIMDKVFCSGSITAAKKLGGINLMGGLELFAPGQVDLDDGTLNVPEGTTSSMAAGSSLSAGSVNLSGGTFNHLGGNNNTSVLNISSSNLNSIPKYILTDGVLNVENLILAASGSGSMSHGGGTATITGNFAHAVAPGSSSMYTLSGNAWLWPMNEQLAVGGHATFMQMDGSTHWVDMELDQAVNMGATSMYTLNGMSSMLWVMNEKIAVGGTATFLHLYGTHTVAGELDFAVNPGSSASYELHAGALNATAEILAVDGSATFTQYGGSTHSAGNLMLAQYPDAVATYNLLGGLLQIGGLSQGAGSAALNVSSGTIRLVSDVYTNVPINSGGGQPNVAIDTSGHTLVIAGGIGGPGSLTILGSGILALIASDSFTGTTSAINGTIILGDSNALCRSTLDLSDSAVLSFGPLANAVLGGLQGHGSFVLANTNAVDLALSVGANDADTMFGGNISDLNGGGSLTKVGMGMLVLSGMNMYGGGTTVMEGTLVAANNMALMDGSALMVGDPTMFSAAVPSRAESPAIAPVPEPGTLALCSAAVCGAAVYQRLRSRRKKE